MNNVSKHFFESSFVTTPDCLIPEIKGKDLHMFLEV